LELVPKFIDELHRKLEPGSMVFCATQRFRGSPEEPWYEKKETGNMVSLWRHDDGRSIEVIDTLFTEGPFERPVCGKGDKIAG
jgi:hypothetical protein